MNADVVSSPEFDQAVDLAYAALIHAMGDSHRLGDKRAVRVALLAALQPEPCPECEGRGEIGGTSMEVYGVHGADFVATGPCESCGGHFPDTVGSGRSNLPPVLVRAVMEQVGWSSDGVLDEDTDYPDECEPVYRYVGLPSITPTEVNDE